MIDWSNKFSKISKYFTVGEACWLPQWNRLHVPTEQEKINILKQAEKMDLVRDFLGMPIIVHCWIRPTEYNKLVSGSERSSHILGIATDFHVKGYETLDKCQEIRVKIEPILEKFDLRMEDKTGSWIHLDHAKVIHKRFFKP